MEKSAENPLIDDFNFVPFDRIKSAHFIPAVDHWIAEAKSALSDILGEQHEASFSNTILPLEQLWFNLNRTSSILFNLHSAETSDELEHAVEHIAPKLSAFSNDLMLDHRLFERIDQLWQKRSKLSLEADEFRLLEKTHRSFKRNGALLSEEQKEKIRLIDQQLSIESIQFGQVVLNDTNNFHLHLTEDQLAGLPEAAYGAALEEAQKRGYGEGGVITLQQPSYGPAMGHLKNRGIREKLYKAFGARGLNGKENNKNRTFTIARLRYQRAKILGYSSHATYVLEERMARTPERVIDFLEDMRIRARPAAERDMEELRTLAEQEGLHELAAWDIAYFSELGKKERFDLDTEQIKPYFQLDRVLQGAFRVAEKLYGIRFVTNNYIPVYQKEVKVYDLLDADGSLRAHLYTDFFPRKGKRPGAWMTSFQDQQWRNDKEYLPQISIVCNFTPPSSDRPSLLNFGEVTTLFHEFGHALHGMLAKGRFASLNGTNVDWDFVELPSQIMENWCFEPECLELFARHYESDVPIPKKEIEKIKNAANYMEGIQTFRQLGFGFLDMKWHHLFDEQDALEDFERKALEVVHLIERTPGTALSTAFSHIFQGGYSAGYYSYKWAEVLDADAFQLFTENGLFDRQTAHKFRELLSSGNQKDPEILFRAFRGRDAQPDALLKRAGLVSYEE